MVPELNISEDEWLLPLAHDNVLTPFTGGDLTPKYVVLHSTGPYWSVDSCIAQWTITEETKESMHLVIRHDGTYVQLAGFKTKVWHCGASYYQGHHGLNNCAIGICLQEPHSNGEYSEEQLSLLDHLLPLIVETYNIRDIVGHMEVSDDQGDPGHNFPLDRYRPFTRYGNAQSAGRYAVSVPAPRMLNVRGGPGERFSIIDKLNGGDSVTLLRKLSTNGLDDWCQISYEQKDRVNRHGWVYESFLKRL